MQCCRHLIQALSRGHTQPLGWNRFHVAAKAADADVQRTNALLQRFREGAANRHHLTYGFHLRAEYLIHALELLEVPARDFNHHIVQGRFKAGRGFPRDVVRNLVQREANRQQRSNLRNRKARRFTRQR